MNGKIAIYYVILLHIYHNDPNDIFIKAMSGHTSGLKTNTHNAYLDVMYGVGDDDDAHVYQIH